MSIIKFINKLTGAEKEISEQNQKNDELTATNRSLNELIEIYESKINALSACGLFYMPFDQVPSQCKQEIGLEVAKYIKMRGLIPEHTYCRVSYCEITNALKIAYKKNTLEEMGIKFDF